MSAATRPGNNKASFVVVANRLPVDRIENPDGSVDWRTSPGGLVTAFEPVMRTHHGAWVGWPGLTGRRAWSRSPTTTSQLEPVHLSARGRRGCTTRASPTRTLWPLYHDVVATPRLPPGVVGPYVAVNQRFAEAAAGVADEGGLVWVQDYQLQLVPQMLRQLRPDLRIGFFLHIPFPPTELFQQLPWRNQILAGTARAPTWSASSCRAAPRTSSGWSGSGSATRPGGTGSARPTAGRSSRGRTRSRSTSKGMHELAMAEVHGRAGRADPARSG